MLLLYKYRTEMLCFLTNYTIKNKNFGNNIAVDPLFKGKLLFLLNNYLLILERNLFTVSFMILCKSDSVFFTCFFDIFVFVLCSFIGFIEIRTCGGLHLFVVSVYCPSFIFLIDCIINFSY